MNRCWLLLLGVVVLAGTWVESASGQVTGSARLRRDSYRVKIISNFGVPVTVGVFGQAKDATFRLTFDGGRTGPDVYTQNLIAGQRVVCVWDAEGSLLFIADLNIDSNGTLELPDSAEYGAVGAARSSDTAPSRSERPELPKLKIKP